MSVKTVTKSHPCPICGKGDWCGVMPSTLGHDLFICQRNTDDLKPYKDGVISKSGFYYVCVGRSKEGHNNIFMDADELKQEDEWKNSTSGRDVIDKSQFKSARNESRPLTPVDIVEPLPNEKLHEIYSAFLSLLILEPRHREYLKKEGWTDELIDTNQIKSFPEEDYIRFEQRSSAYYSKNPWRKTLGTTLSTQFGSLEGVPGAYLNQKGNWTFYGEAGILFPLYDAHHQIYRLRIRLDNVNAKGKYRNFSSFKINEDEEKKGFYINRFQKGCQSGNNLGFYINPMRDDMYIAYITEGEKKGILGEYILKAPFISVPGVNSYAKLVTGAIGKRPIDSLREKGIKILIIAYDADKSTNEKVMLSQKRTIEILKKEGFLIGLAEWDIRYGKGIDDLLIGGRKPQYFLA